MAPQKIVDTTHYNLLLIILCVIFINLYQTDHHINHASEKNAEHLLTK